MSPRESFDEASEAELFELFVPIESGLKRVEAGEQSALYLDDEAISRILEKFSSIEEALERAMRRLREPSIQDE